MIRPFATRRLCGRTHKHRSAKKNRTAKNFMKIDLLIIGVNANRRKLSTADPHDLNPVLKL